MDPANHISLKVVDSHCHIASEEYYPNSFVQGSVLNMLQALKAQGVPATAKGLTGMFLQTLQDPHCDTLVAEMAEAGISKSILLIADFSYALKDCRITVEESFHKHREVLARHPGKLDSLRSRSAMGKRRIGPIRAVACGIRVSRFQNISAVWIQPQRSRLFPYYDSALTIRFLSSCTRDQPLPLWRLT